VTVPLHDRVKIGTLKTTRGRLGDDNRALDELDRN
jgi:hypothetical protein